MLTALTKARWDPMTGRAAKDDCGAPVVVSYQSSNGTAPKPPEAYLTTEEMRRSRVAVSVTKAAVHISHPGHCMRGANEQALMKKVHDIKHLTMYMDVYILASINWIKDTIVTSLPSIKRHSEVFGHALIPLCFYIEA